MRKIIVDVEDSGAVKARIIGGHLCKRELLRVLKAIRLEYRHSVRTYRTQMIIKAHEAVEKEKVEASAELGERSNGEDRIAEQKQ